MQLCTHYLDLHGVPRRYFFEQLAHFATQALRAKPALAPHLPQPCEVDLRDRRRQTAHKRTYRVSALPVLPRSAGPFPLPLTAREHVSTVAYTDGFRPPRAAVSTPSVARCTACAQEREREKLRDFTQTTDGLEDLDQCRPPDRSL